MSYVIINSIINIFTSLIDYFKSIFVYKHHGNHVFADFIWDVKTENIDDFVLCDNVFKIIEKAVRRTQMKIVHKKFVILGKTEESPPGFTSIILIDESHISSHCYSDRGWLAIDCFTCGYTNPEPIMDYISGEIKNNYPSLICTYKRNHKRFHYI